MQWKGLWCCTTSTCTCFISNSSEYYSSEVRTMKMSYICSRFLEKTPLSKKDIDFDLKV